MKTALTSEELITLNTYNTKGAEWASKKSTPNYWKKEMKMFIKHLPMGKILEIGSGSGRDAKELSNLGYEYLGTDISTGLLLLARQNNLELNFLEQSVYDLEFSEKFDGFWCSATLLHIPKARIDEALKRIYGCMKRDAVGFISLKEGRGEELSADRRFFAYYSTAEFKKILSRNKYRIIETSRKETNEPYNWLSFFVKTK